MPEGMEFRDVDGLVDTTSTGVQESQDACVVPSHKFLTVAFRLKSKAFMLTYNSKTLKDKDWPAFVEHIRSLARKFGARAWSACLEESLNARSQTESPKFG